MKRISKILITAMALTVAITGIAMATPSTQIWIPSTDVQAYKTFHLGIDSYIRATKNNDGTRGTNLYDIGPVVGFLPFEKLQGEIGFDYTSNTTINDNHPLSGNVKIATPEDSLFKMSPAIAVGGYNLGPAQGTATAPSILSGQNIVYGLVAKTVPAIGAVPSLGRLSAGYYRGAELALVNSAGKADNDGVLLSWDRTMTECSQLRRILELRQERFRDLRLRHLQQQGCERSRQEHLHHPARHQLPVSTEGRWPS